MPTLLIDTATDVLVAGVADGPELLAHAERHARAQELLMLVDDALGQADVARSQIDAIAVGIGPGAFTGLRVGVSTARGLASALDVPLAPVSSLAAVAVPLAREHDDAPVWSAIDARRGEVFMRRWRRVSGIAGFSMVPESELLVVAAAAARDRSAHEPYTLGVPTADALAELALLAPYGAPELVLPRYGREPDATPPQRAQRAAT